MKFQCSCGREILDAGDGLPQKGRVIPDQEWFPIQDALDEIIEAAADGRMGKDEACHRAREVVSRSARLMWQCRSCGRLHVDGTDRRLRSFTPDSEPVDREILRGRSR